MFVAKSEKLAELIESLGEFGVAKTALGARVSIGVLNGMRRGRYTAAPRQVLRERLCLFFGVSESDLFYEVEDKVRAKPKRKAA